MPDSIVSQYGVDFSNVPLTSPIHPSYRSAPARHASNLDAALRVAVARANEIQNKDDSISTVLSSVTIETLQEFIDRCGSLAETLTAPLKASVIGDSGSLRDLVQMGSRAAVSLVEDFDVGAQTDLMGKSVWDIMSVMYDDGSALMEAALSSRETARMSVEDRADIHRGVDQIQDWLRDRVICHKLANLPNKILLPMYNAPKGADVASKYRARLHALLVMQEALLWIEKAGWSDDCSDGARRIYENKLSGWLNFRLLNADKTFHPSTEVIHGITRNLIAGESVPAEYQCGCDISKVLQNIIQPVRTKVKL